MNKLTNPSGSDLDAMLRAAHRRGRLDHLDDQDDDPGTAPAESEAPKPGPLPGGAAAPTPPAPPTGEQILRAALAAARGHHVDWSARHYVSPGEATSATFTVPR